MTHYNTTGLVGNDLKKANINANSQSGKIMDYLKVNGFNSISPTEAHRLILPNNPITSVRRALTDLASMGLLEKSSQKRMGGYGQLEHIWRIPNRIPTQPRLF